MDRSPLVKSCLLVVGLLLYVVCRCYLHVLLVVTMLSLMEVRVVVVVVVVIASPRSYFHELQSTRPSRRSDERTVQYRGGRAGSCRQGQGNLQGKERHGGDRTGTGTGQAVGAPKVCIYMHPSARRLMTALKRSSLSLIATMIAVRSSPACHRPCRPTESRGLRVSAKSITPDMLCMHCKFV